MVVVGKNMSKNAEGLTVTTLHVQEEFEPYYQNAEAGRTACGVKVSTIYVGAYPCKDIQVGDTIDIMYEKAVQTKKGVYQPIKRIDIVSKASK